MTSTEMNNAIEAALASAVSYRSATEMCKDAFRIARCNAKASTDPVDIRIHWNWFALGWSAAHIWFTTIASTGAH
jgi:hypothetical protein